jgi:hypothetical protein
MRWLCLFLPCKWIHLTNIITENADRHKTLIGLWQCPRCKTLSRGRAK